MAEKVLPLADQVEDNVMGQLPTLTLEQLVEIGALIGFTIETDIQDNRREILRQLMRHLCTTTTDDDKMTEFLQINDYLKDKTGNKSVDVVKVEGVATGGPAVTLAPPAKSSDTVKQGQNTAGTSVRTEITKMRLKEFKIPGTIGGDGENALSYDSLMFEVEKGRKLGYTDTEMCSAIISKTADEETRNYFVTTPDIELQDVLDMLKSAFCTEKESSNLFTQFTNDKQGKDEKPLTFITRVLRLRRRVYTLGQEEGSNYDQNMLARRSLQVIFGGLRDENVRSALRDKCKDDFSLEDKIIHKHASEIIAAEEERKLKLFGKTPGVMVQQVTKHEVEEHTSSKKEKLNPFVKIEELRLENERRCELLQCQLSEIKNILVARNKADEEIKLPKEEQKSKQKKRFGRCETCVLENKHKCFHCWDCGQDDHKRGASECPKNS